MSMSAPAPPDPVATANAQQTLNQNTAKYQQEVNNVNQNTPFGSVAYSQTGTNPDGSPIFSANTTLSPAEQKLFDASTGTQAKIAGDASTLADNLGSSLTNAPNLNNSALVQQMEGWGNQVMQPQLNQEQSSLDSTLANQGAAEGSQAWQNAQRNFGQNENQAYANLFSSIEPTAYSQALSSYEAPIQTLGTLLGEGQPQSNVNQSLAPTSQASIQPANEESLVQQDYQSQLSNYQNTMSGLFSIPSALLGGWARTGFTSDARLKKDIVKVGALYDGTPIYRFVYKSGGPAQIGLMAQDVIEDNPAAVMMRDDGFMMVDYVAATERAARMGADG